MGRPQGLALVLFFLPGGLALAENPWREKLPDALATARREPTRESLGQAFDISYRADDWAAGLELAGLAAKHFPNDPPLNGLALRALWRGGRLREAERLADRIMSGKADRSALGTLVELNLARGRAEDAARAAGILEATPERSPEETYRILQARFRSHRYDGLPELLRKAADQIDPANGYPETFISESVAGLPEFFAAIGNRPLNRVRSFGAAAMPPLTGTGLPSCDAMINGQGPFRLIVDTGGSITLSLDRSAAETIGLRPLASSSIRGVSGLQDATMSTVERLEVGGIACENVMTHVFDLPDVLTGSIDGVLGTGVFGEARMTFDFVDGRIRIEASSPTAGAGTEVAIRLIGDSKMITLPEIGDRGIVALMDTGADAVALSPTFARAEFESGDLREVSIAAAVGVGGGDSGNMLFTPGLALRWGGRTFEGTGGLALSVLDDLLSPVVGIQIQMLAGMPIFREMKTFTVDFPSARAWVVWNESADGS